MRFFIAVLLMCGVVNADGERAKVTVLSAKVRAGILSRPEMPDTPPGLRLSGVASASAAKYKMTVLGAKWCKPCLIYDGNLKDFVEVDVEHLDVDTPDDLAKADKEFGGVPRDAGRIMLPTTLFKTQDGKSRYFHGIETKESVLQILKRNNAATGGQLTPAKAAGIGQLKGYSTKVRQSVEWWSANVRGPVTWTWDSNRNDGKGGNDGFAILHAKSSDWTCDRILGTLGSFTVSCPDGISIGKQLFKELRITYRSSGDDILVDTSFAISKSAIEKNQPKVAATYAFVDPATALTILSILRGLWEIAHPEVDLQLPGRISATTSVKDGSFLIDFTSSPRIRIKAYWEWMLGVDWVLVSPTMAHLEMEPQPRSLFPILSREVSITD